MIHNLLQRILKKKYSSCDSSYNYIFICVYKYLDLGIIHRAILFPVLIFGLLINLKI